MRSCSSDLVKGLQLLENSRYTWRPAVTCSKHQYATRQKSRRAAKRQRHSERAGKPTETPQPHLRDLACSHRNSQDHNRSNRTPDTVRPTWQHLTSTSRLFATSWKCVCRSRVLSSLSSVMQKTRMAASANPTRRAKTTNFAAYGMAQASLNSWSDSCGSPRGDRFGASRTQNLKHHTQLWSYRYASLILRMTL